MATKTTKRIGVVGGFARAQQILRALRTRGDSYAVLFTSAERQEQGFAVNIAPHGAYVAWAQAPTYDEIEVYVARNAWFFGRLTAGGRAARRTFKSDKAATRYIQGVIDELETRGQ